MKTLIISTVAAKLANESGYQIEMPTQNGEALVCPLSPTGALPATNFACCVELKGSERNRIVSRTLGAILIDYDPEKDPDGARAAIVAAGLKRVIAIPK